MKIESLQYGLIYSFIHGGYADTLKMSNDQKQRLREISKRWLRRIDEESKRLVEELEQTILGLLDERQTERLKEFLGEPIDNGRSNIELIISQLIDQTDIGRFIPRQ